MKRLHGIPLAPLFKKLEMVGSTDAEKQVIIAVAIEAVRCIKTNPSKLIDITARIMCYAFETYVAEEQSKMVNKAIHVVMAMKLKVQHKTYNEMWEKL